MGANSNTANPSVISLSGSNELGGTVRLAV